MISTVISDSVLCLCALLAARLAWPRAWAAGGLLLLALSAALGALRYSVLPELAPAHRAISFLAGTLGLPALLMGYLRAPPRMALAVLGGLATLSALFWLQPQLRLGIGLAGLAAWSWQGWRARGASRRAIIAGVTASLAAAAFAAPGQRLGLPNVDWLHYLLAISVIAFAIACNPWRLGSRGLVLGDKTGDGSARMIARHG